MFLGYFPSNPQDKFYQSEKFRNIISYLQQNPQDAQLKEKNNQLLMRKDKVENVEAISNVMEGILEKQ